MVWSSMMCLNVSKICWLSCRDFAYVARDRVTRRHMCHVFRCDTPARTIANTLRDICKKIMIERSLQHSSTAKNVDAGTPKRHSLLVLNQHSFKKKKKKKNSFRILLWTFFELDIRNSSCCAYINDTFNWNNLNWSIYYAGTSVNSTAPAGTARNRPSNLPSEQRRSITKIGQILSS